MAEYRIVAKLDPQTAAGTQKVKQDLRGIQTEAKVTEGSLSRAFDQGKFDKTIGGLTGRLDALDRKLDALGKSTTQSAKGMDAATASANRMTAAQFRAAGGVEGLKKAQQGATQSATQQEAALRRVLAAVDAGAAEQLRANQILAEAKRLFDAGRISAEQYAAAQRIAAGTGKDLVTQTGSQRMGLQQLGFQLGDVATMYSLGAKPAQIFGSQIGQVSQALMLMGGGPGGGALGAVAKFLGGPWGIAFTVALIALTPFVGKIFESSDALGEKIKKMKEDAREAELDRQAHEAFSRTLDGVIEKTRDYTKAMLDRLKVQSQVDRRELTDNRQRVDFIQEQLDAEKQANAKLRADLDKAARQMPTMGARTGETGRDTAEFKRIQGLLNESDKRIAKLNADVQNARNGIIAAETDMKMRQGAAFVDLTSRAEVWADEYKNSVQSILNGNESIRKSGEYVSGGFTNMKTAIDAAASAGVNFDATRNKANQLLIDLKDGKIAPKEFGYEMTAMARTLKAAADAADKAGRSVSDGVARFRSAKQAVGIAGRELQQAGFKVSENEQFGGVTPGAHRGAGHAEGRAIDVEIDGATDKAPTPPDIRAKYDALARRYAARGYIVLWAGNRYDPSGKVTPITGADKHYGHMHLEAPQTIVGKPTQASGEAQVIREENQLERVQERAEDFVENVVRNAGKRGIPANAKDQLNAAIATTLQEFEDRFKRAANDGEKAKITEAFTEADKRETVQRFEEAYVQPLERLRKLQGVTGIEREILNAKLSEEARLKRELTPVEAAMVENGIRNGDQLSRQAQILEQIRAPLDNYRKTIAALNELLATGAINQAAYNARITEMNVAAANKAFSGMEQQVDPATGRNYEDLGAIFDEQARYAAQLEAIKQFREMKLQLGIDYDAMELNARIQHEQNLAKIDQARKDMQMGLMQDIAGNVTSIMRNAFGEQSRIARAAFVAEKAVAIARAIVAIQTGIAQAAALPFPANLPAIASVVAATASIVSNIRSATIGYKDGGLITGPGGPREDRVPIMASPGEFMVNAEATKKFRPLLERMNDGGGGAFAEGGLVKTFPVPVKTANDNLGVVTSPGGVTRTLGKDGKPLNPADDPALTAEQRNSIYLERIATATEGMFKLMEKAEERRKKNRKWNVLKGFMTGGIIGGALTALTEFDGGGWTGEAPVDRETGRVHGQEFVVKSPYARQNRTMLEAINSGRQVRQAQDQRVAQAMGTHTTPPAVNVTPPPAVVKVVVVKDEEEAKRYLDSYEGEAHFIKLVNNNADTVARAAGQSGA